MSSRRHPHHPVLITSATPSRYDEIAAKQRRYVASMVFRTIAFALAVLLLHGIARWIALAIAVVTPWLAVVAANGAPRRRAEAVSYDTGPVPREIPEPTGGQDHDPREDVLDGRVEAPPGGRPEPSAAPLVPRPPGDGSPPG